MLLTHGTLTVPNRHGMERKAPSLLLSSVWALDARVHRTNKCICNARFPKAQESSPFYCFCILASSVDTAVRNTPTLVRFSSVTALRYLMHELRYLLR